MTVRSAVVVCELLKALRLEPLTMSQIEQTCDLNRNTLRRWMPTLIEHGFVRQVDTIKTSQRGRKPARRFAVTRQWGGNA